MRCVPNCIVPVGLVLLVCGTQGFFLANVTHLEKLLSKYQQDEPHSRVRRAIPRSDKEEILMLHNKLRGQVYPPASNMEYMVSAGLPPRVGPGLCPPLVGVWQAWGSPGKRESPVPALDPCPKGMHEFTVQRPPHCQHLMSPLHSPPGHPTPGPPGLTFGRVQSPPRLLLAV